MRRGGLFALALAAVLTGCTRQEQPAQNKRYEASFLNLFDTVTTIVGWAETEEEFARTVQQIYDQLLGYHQLFDIYNSYPGVNNLKTINDRAGIAPVKVDGRLIELLLFCKEMDSGTGGKVNVGLGGVLALWHKARSAGIEDPERAALPDMDALLQAAEHTDLEDVIIDEENSTVYLADPELRLDVGAIAKGYAVERVCRGAPQGLLISVGGNVCATGPNPGSEGPWVVGLRDPDGGEDYLHTLYISGGAVVTSGDYQRYYTLDGTRYHHIIDPDTLMPGGLWRCVSVLCPDSGVADALSTALFLLPREQGQQLLEQWEGEAMWVDRAGNKFFSPGFSDYIRT